MKILIVEDEPRAARQLESMLKKCNVDYHLLAILDSVEESVEWFQNNPSPELVFLDIQLADGLSFEIFQKVEVNAPIIFTTAFDQYAIQAFKVNSIDYLLKPIQKEELDVALEKYKKTSSKGMDQLVLQQLILSMQTKKYRASILVKQGGGLVQLKVSELLYAYSEDGIIFGKGGAKRYVIDETMDQLFQSLDPSMFFRINRGQVVSKAAILKIDPYFNHRVKLSIVDSKDQEFIVSRPKTSEFKLWMNS